MILPNNRGIALIQVLLISAIISVFVIYIQKEARAVISLTQGLADKNEARVHLHQVESQLLFGLVTEGAGFVTNRPEGNFIGRPFEFDEKTTLILQDLSGRLPLNGFDESLVKKLLEENGLSRTHADEIIDSILDWQDKDSLRRLNGAEAGNYNGIEPRNAEIQFIDELKQIKGVNDQAYKVLHDVLTVHLPKFFNPAVASDKLLVAMYGDNIAQKLIEARSNGLLTENLFFQLTQGVGESATVALGDLIKVDISVRVGESIASKKIVFKLEPHTESDLPMEIIEVNWN